MSLSLDAVSSKRRIGNIETFARLYGYIRYFHPSDEASAVNWYSFAVHGIRTVENAASRAQLLKTLKELFSPMAPTLTLYFTGQKDLFKMSRVAPKTTTNLEVVSWQHLGIGFSSKRKSFRSLRLNRKNDILNSTGPLKELFSQRVKIGEYRKKNLGMGISCTIPMALYSVDGKTWPVANQKAFRELSGKLSQIKSAQLKADDFYTRAASIIIAWNVYQHFYPYFKVVPPGWAKQLTVALKKALYDENPEDFLHTLRSLSASTYDGSGLVFHPLLTDQANIPLKMEWIGNRLVITTSKDDRIKRGDIILSIDGILAKNKLRRVERLISGSPQWKRFYAMKLIGLGDKGSTARLEIGRNNRSMRFEIKRDFKKRLIEFFRPAIQELPDNIWYVDLGNVPMDAFQSHLGKLAQARGIIFDARNHVGFDKRAILSHLTEKKIKSAIHNIPEVLYPDRERMKFNGSQREITPSEPLFKGKTVFLVNGGCIGSTEGFMAIVEHYRLGEILGTTTAGTDGDINSFRIPGDYRVYFTGARVLKQRWHQFHLIGVKPTIAAGRTIDGVKNGRDELLELAVQKIKEMR